MSSVVARAVDQGLTVRPRQAKALAQPKPTGPTMSGGLPPGLAQWPTLSYAGRDPELAGDYGVSLCEALKSSMDLLLTRPARAFHAPRQQYQGTTFTPGATDSGATMPAWAVFCRDGTAQGRWMASLWCVPARRPGPRARLFREHRGRQRLSQRAGWGGRAVGTSVGGGVPFAGVGGSWLPAHSPPHHEMPTKLVSKQ